MRGMRTSHHYFPLLVFSINLGGLHWVEACWKSRLMRGSAEIWPKPFWKQVRALVLWLCQYSSSVLVTGCNHIWPKLGCFPCCCSFDANPRVEHYQIVDASHTQEQGKKRRSVEQKTCAMTVLNVKKMGIYDSFGGVRWGLSHCNSHILMWELKFWHKDDK